jgi:hypothetical protein
MEPRFSFTLRQVLLIAVVIVILTAALTLVIFYLGQQNALRLAEQSGLSTRDASATGTAAVPTLPRAMTATPKEHTPETYSLTDSQATALLQEQIAQSGQGAVLQVDAVSFTPQQIEVVGQIDYMEYQGELHMTCKPVALDNRLRLQITRVTVDGQDLPEMLFPVLEEQINPLFDQILSGYDIQAVELEQGQIKMTVLPW